MPMERKYPIARCANPGCGCTILYSDDPRDKRNVTVHLAEPNHAGPTLLCPRCKKMLVIIEKPKVAAGFVALPVIHATM